MRGKGVKARVLEVVTAGPGVTVTELCLATGKSRPQIRFCLHRLLREGKAFAIRPEGSRAKLWHCGPAVEIRVAQIITAIQTDMSSLECSHYGTQVMNRCRPLLEELHGLIGLLTKSLNESARP
jgi:hypothetical protein